MIVRQVQRLTTKEAMPIRWARFGHCSPHRREFPLNDYLSLSFRFSQNQSGFWRNRLSRVHRRIYRPQTRGRSRKHECYFFCMAAIANSTLKRFNRVNPFGNVCLISDSVHRLECRQSIVPQGFWYFAWGQLGEQSGYCT